MLYREAPVCIICGQPIRGIYRKQDKDFIGDSFIRWDYHGHVCPPVKPKRGKFLGVVLQLDSGEQMRIGAESARILRRTGVMRVCFHVYEKEKNT